jgi:hypothetical protein
MTLHRGQVGKLPAMDASTRTLAGTQSSQHSKVLRLGFQERIKGSGAAIEVLLLLASKLDFPLWNVYHTFLSLLTPAR